MLINYSNKNNIIVFGYLTYDAGQAINQSNAEIGCLNNFGTSLPTISSDIENALMLSMCPGICWIGATDVDTEDTFVWSSNNATLSYTKWDTNEPNGGLAENCVQMLSNGFWNDITCSMTLSNIVVCDNLTLTETVIDSTEYYSTMNAITDPAFGVLSVFMQKKCVFFILFFRFHGRFRFCD